MNRHKSVYLFKTTGNTVFVTLVSLFIFFMTSARSQELNGVWLNLKKQNEVTFPFVDIIKITEDGIYHFDFDDPKFSFPYTIMGSTIYRNDSISYNYSFRNRKDILVLKMFNPKEDKYVFTTEYINIKPTVLLPHLLDTIKSSVYNATFNGIDNKLQFDKELREDELIYLGKDFIIGNKVGIKEWEGTLYLIFYINGGINHVIPIKEATPDYLLLYGVLGHDSEVIAKRMM